MIADLMLRALLSAGLVALAAACMDGIARQFGWQRRWIWAAALAGSLVLPLAGAWLPAPGLVAGPGFEDAPAAGALALPAGAGAIEVPAAAPGTAATTPRDLLNVILLIVWIVASAGLLAMLVWSGSQLRTARLTGARARLSGVPVVVADSFGPAVVGVLRPSVLLPTWVTELPPHERRLIAAHEWEHVRARDTMLLAAAAAALVIAPWNAALWWQHRRLTEAIETDCDARLLRRGVDRHAYGLVLLHTAGRARAFPLLSPSLAHTRSTLERRILAMTYRAPRHRLARSGGLVALAALGLAAACDFASNRPTSSPTDPVVPELSMAAGEAGESAAPAAGTYVVLEPSEAGEWLEIEAVGEEAERTRFRVTRVRGEEADAEQGILRARRVALTGEGEPLYVVDGVIARSLDVDTLDVVRVAVVKGAAAEPIWGARAANGVVQITTATAAGGASAGMESIRLAPTRAIGEGGRFRLRATPEGEPIYLVDGVRIDAPDLDALDIDRVEVLKGSAARAVVDDAGPAGVVRITTKRGAASERTEQGRGPEQLELQAASVRSASELIQFQATTVQAASDRMRLAIERIQATAHQLAEDPEWRTKLPAAARGGG